MRSHVNLLVLVLAMLLAGCDDSATVRYRVTVEIQTPQGLRSGSSVWSFKLSRPTLALASPYDAKFRGEAIAVDLPEGRTLFALISQQEYVPEAQFRDLAPGGPAEDRVAVLRAIAGHQGLTRQLRCPETWNGGPGREDEIRTDCPTLVTFTNPHDPMSVQEVDPGRLSNQFGQGFALRRITVEITDDAVTRQISDRLDALNIVPNQSLDREFKSSTNPTLAERTGYSDFVEGIRY